MIEIFPNLYVGNGTDLPKVQDGNGGILEGWYVVSAGKDPWHREALGYTTRGAPKDSDEYLWAKRPQRLILNLVDIPDPAYIREDIIEATVAAIDAALQDGQSVLVHCNQGESRAPTLALLWMRLTDLDLIRAAFSLLTFEQACEAMKVAYPPYNPGEGMKGRAKAMWEAE